MRAYSKAGNQLGFIELNSKAHHHWQIVSAAVFIGLLTGGAWLFARAEARLVRAPRTRSTGIRFSEGDYDLSHESALERTELASVGVTAAGECGSDEPHLWETPRVGPLAASAGRPPLSSRYLVPTPSSKAPDLLPIRRLSARGPPAAAALLSIASSK